MLRARVFAALGLTGSLAVAGLAASLAAAGAAYAQDQPAVGGPPQPKLAASGLPVPRFVSLKSNRVNARQGPRLDQKVLWVYRRAGLPLEVIGEFEGWRRIRDSDGAEGWVVQSLISGRRTALVMPWDARQGKKTKVELRDDDSESARTVAIVEAGVIANIRTCDTRWCYVSVGDYRGYIPQKLLWGVYPGETVR